MKQLYLSGFGISLNVDRARLLIRNGLSEPDTVREQITVLPRNAPFDSVIVDGHSGSLSLDAIKWLARHNIAMFVLDFNGKILTSMLPREPVNGALKLAQLATYNNPQKRMLISKRLIAAKAQRTLDVLEWLDSRYDRIDSVTDSIRLKMKRIDESESLPRLMQVEGDIADRYWDQLMKILPKKFGFVSRMHESHQMNSADQVNTLVNYCYSILESQVRKALNSVGLEATIGFLHEARQTKYSLCYDVMEPYRFLADTTVIECLEHDRFGRKDFYRLDNYVLRLKPEAVKKLLDALRIKFNSPVRYRNKLYGWDVIMRLKAQELAAFILNKRTTISFEEPRPVLQRDDSETLREAILSMSASEARRRGIRGNTLWYAQRRAKSREQFKIYTNLKSRICEPSVS
ncbi:MAG TPA: CRISPR-associated endonuclease Cas1 [Candidatus Acidoferrum sp.]|nr:CRISPR-associated endonuclease Cas1 [Candidatus Acidoferrum sp.]